MAKKLYWWNVSDLVNNGLVDMLNSAEAARMEFDPKTALIVVKDRDGNVCGTYNESHLCPPDCD